MTAARSPVRRAARLLAALARTPATTVLEASRRLDLPYATCHRLMRILLEEGLVERGSGKAYRVASFTHPVRGDLG